VSLLVGFSVEAEWPLSVRLVGNDRLGTALVQPLAQGCAIISPVTEKFLGRLGTTDQPLGMRLVAGRLLSDRRTQDQFGSQGDSGKGANECRNILIDNVAAATLGLTPQQAVGKSIIIGKSHVNIVGILANVKFGGARRDQQIAY